MSGATYYLPPLPREAIRLAWLAWAISVFVGGAAAAAVFGVSRNLNDGTLLMGAVFGLGSGITQELLFRRLPQTQKSHRWLLLSFPGTLVAWALCWYPLQLLLFSAAQNPHEYNRVGVFVSASLLGMLFGLVLGLCQAPALLTVLPYELGQRSLLGPWTLISMFAWAAGFAAAFDYLVANGLLRLFVFKTGTDAPFYDPRNLNLDQTFAIVGAVLHCSAWIAILTGAGLYWLLRREISKGW